MDICVHHHVYSMGTKVMFGTLMLRKLWKKLAKKAHKYY